MASSSTSFNQKSFKYHVFLSFRGEDTRKTFVDHLYTSLKQLGIYTFRDNEELEKGKRIDELFKAIEDSRFFIIVFSRNYASSSWCLKEVTKIMECQDEKQQIAYPLFYDVEPSDIRKRSGPVGRAIAKHKSNEQIKKWEKALESAGNLVGWDLKNIANGHEAEAIKKIGEEISLKLCSIHLGNDENLIGMDRRMQELASSLGIGLNDKVRMIGIKGMGGIGKTTLARAIFDKVSSLFEGSTFLEDVRELSKKKNGMEISIKEGLRSLQERILSGVLNDEHMRVWSVHDGKEYMKMRLPYKKVLLVLDDVDDAEQLEALAGDWFKDGSRVIITTRDEKVLLAHGVNVNWIYDVSLLSDEEAMSLFCRYAFKRYIPDEGYEKLSSEVVRYAAGLPLTIKVLGSHLCGENEDVWRGALKRLKTIPSRETLEVLEISYNSLEDDHKELFLDVACFLKGFPKGYAIRMLDSCGYSAAYGLRILEQRSLITILNGRLGMHDKIEELGKNIVRRSHPHEPNKHSRLWIREEIEELFTDDWGTEASTCIGLQLMPKELNPEIIIKKLGNLNKLRYLSLYGNLDDCFPSGWNFDQTKQYFPNSLQFLYWRAYPGLSLPQTFLANNLVGIELAKSRILQLWGSGERKVLKKLRFLGLRDSKLRTLDLRMAPNLENLDLSGCHDLIEIYAPAGCLKRLIFVNLVGCSWSVSSSLFKQLESLVLLSIPNLIVSVECLKGFLRDSTSNLPVLQFTFYYSKEQPSKTEIDRKGVFLDLQPCTKLECVSGRTGFLQHLRRLTFKGCIPEVPNDLDQLKCLEELTLYSTNIKCLPDSVCMLKCLKSLSLIDCQHLEELPENLGWLENLEELNVSSTILRHLPDSICMLIHLKCLLLDSCKFVEKLPEDIGQLECLEELNLTKCASVGDIPNSICKMKCLRYLFLHFCSQVQKLPEEFGNLKLLEVLDVVDTGISHLPHNISSMNGLCIFGSISLLDQLCAFTTKIETSENGPFCYIQAVNSTPTPTELRSQSTENHLKRWWWWCW
ncbi:disease resistance protein RPV1 [Lactuca sativa]|uniref:disease resistance protein RPV1 n=1 Tax=Lactuca sativa TaxID=4236 RepID=UPI001C687EBC|nr:disease resistance protein RPV1 [Lactuca sativa]XP_052626240.1 disease resistance protein RPV1 [Lactuca sativa]